MQAITPELREAVLKAEKERASELAKKRADAKAAIDASFASTKAAAALAAFLDLIKEKVPDFLLSASEGGWANSREVAEVSGAAFRLRLVVEKITEKPGKKSKGK